MMSTFLLVLSCVAKLPISLPLQLITSLPNFTTLTHALTNCLTHTQSHCMVRASILCISRNEYPQHYSSQEYIWQPEPIQADVLMCDVRCGCAPLPLLLYVHEALCYAIMLCYMLCYAMLCSAMLCWRCCDTPLPCYVMLCNAMPCHAMPHMIYVILCTALVGWWVWV
jgi:hypothetical protein